MPLPRSILLLCTFFSTTFSLADELDWPEVTRETKPWARWWWQGSAVNAEDLAKSLEQYAAAGLGGMEITPIYGVHGYEDQFIAYLSPEWVEMLEHTLEQAERLDLGIDMATGTGWPFGGPSVTAEGASKYVAHAKYSVSGGGRLTRPIEHEQDAIIRSVSNRFLDTDRPLKASDLVEPISQNENLQALALDQIRFPKPLPLQALMAYSNDGAVIDLTDLVDADGMLDWTAPAGDWKLYAVFMGLHGKMVERAAPGGEGLVIDHFSNAAIQNYLARFDAAFDGHDISQIRAFFNDSYEVDDANGQATWTAGFFTAFQERRGYDLREHLPALFGDDDAASSSLVLADYRETVSDLLLQTFTKEWAEWAKNKDAVIRNQAHGSPANILDLYAASNIPEAEGEEDLRVRWATSAAHVAGRPLVSAEAGTWLKEHFQSRLSDVRQAVDHFFLNGINHIVYHGTNYSPSDESWPGWLFYAATHFNPRNSWWTDFGKLNLYVARAQSFLQSGQPQNDVLLYFPAYADYAVRGNALLKHYGEARQKIAGSDFIELANLLQQRGYTHDFVSDQQLREIFVSDNRLIAPGGVYRTILVPQADFIPLNTFEQLLDLAHAGASVIFHQSLPKDVAGLGNRESKRVRFKRLVASLELEATTKPDAQKSEHGQGSIVLTSSLEATLESTGVTRETLVDHGLKFTRRRDEDGTFYFLSNPGKARFEGWLGLQAAGNSAALFDPMTGASGYIDARSADQGGVEVFLQIAPGESLVLKTFQSETATPAFPFFRQAGSSHEISGPWEVAFLNGGPALPASKTLNTLSTWTDFEGPGYAAFSGTARYTVKFARPDGHSAAWRLDLGDVRHSARVTLNGEEIGTLIGPTYQLVLSDDQLLPNNTLEIHVSNLMANRIADLDKRGVFWKKHYNVNFPARLGANRGEDGLFTAKRWEPDESGLIGPVTLTPLESVQ